jgi:prepilin-type N-terminal cleavage/methylation domain-containing protein
MPQISKQGCRVGARGGFTLLEFAVSLSVLLVALLALSQSIVTSMRLADSSRETRLASSASRAMLELLDGADDFASVFRRYNANPDDDGALLAPGSHFPVNGLAACKDDLDGMVGEIVFPTAGFELREDLVDPSLGMPRDLNGDGLIDSLDHSQDFRLLPVLVHLRWTGADGERTLEMRTLLADR